MMVNPMSFNNSKTTIGHISGWLSIVCLFVAGTVIHGCATVQNAEVNSITVEGYTIVMGNEPFAEVILTTSDNNSYVLKMNQDLRGTLTTPAQLRVSGRLYLSTWDGRPFAHIDVVEYSRMD